MPKLDLNGLHQRGILLIAVELAFVITFLIGGGVVGSTDGGYWTGIFFLGFFGGLVGLGPFVYHFANSTFSDPQTTQKSRWPLRMHFLNTIVIALAISLSQAFLRSELSRSPVVMHLFIVGTGVSLSLFFALGLGFTHAHAKRNQSIL